METLIKANEARKENALNKLYNFYGIGIKSFKQLIDNGTFVDSKITEEPKVKYNRVKYNRMDNAQQIAYEKTMQEMKTVYNLCYADNSFAECPKMVFEYYNETQGKEKCSECENEMNEMDHNYGTEDILVCIHCYQDAQF